MGGLNSDFFGSLCFNLCRGPGALPPLCRARRSLCRVRALSRSLCRARRSLRRGRGPFCVGFRCSLCRARATHPLRKAPALIRAPPILSCESHPVPPIQICGQIRDRPPHATHPAPHTPILLIIRLRAPGSDPRAIRSGPPAQICCVPPIQPGAPFSRREPQTQTLLLGGKLYIIILYKYYVISHYVIKPCLVSTTYICREQMLEAEVRAAATSRGAIRPAEAQTCPINFMSSNICHGQKCLMS